MSNQPNLFDDGKPKPKNKRGTAKQCQLIFQALCDVSGDDGIDVKHITESARGSINRAVREIMETENGQATVEQVQRVAKGMRKQWPSIVVTPSSIKVHWGMFVTEKRARLKVKKDIYYYRLGRLKALTPEAYGRVSKRCDPGKLCDGPGDLRFADGIDEALDAEETDGD